MKALDIFKKVESFVHSFNFSSYIEKYGYQYYDIHFLIRNRVKKDVKLYSGINDVVDCINNSRYEVISKFFDGDNHNVNELVSLFNEYVLLCIKDNFPEVYILEDSSNSNRNYIRLHNRFYIINREYFLFGKMNIDTYSKIKKVSLDLSSIVTKVINNQDIIYGTFNFNESSLLYFILRDLIDNDYSLFLDGFIYNFLIYNMIDNKSSIRERQYSVGIYDDAGLYFKHENKVIQTRLISDYNSYSPVVPVAVSYDTISVTDYPDSYLSNIVSNNVDDNIIFTSVF